MADLVTLSEVKRHLRLPEEFDSPLSAHDEDLQTKTDIATDAVLRYTTHINDTAWPATVAGWTLSTAPQVVRGAILRQVAYLYRYRGDDDEGVAPLSSSGLCPGAEMLLKQLKDPTLA